MDGLPGRYFITDETVLNLKPLSFKTVNDEEIVSYIYYHCQKLLLIAKEKNESKEVAVAINLDSFLELKPVFGDLRSVNIDALVEQMRVDDCPFLVIHNHPSGLTFSRRDIKTFVDAENITIIIVLGNNGSVFVMEKTKQLSMFEILSIRKALLDYKNYQVGFTELIKHIEEFGIVYNEL